MGAERTDDLGHWRLRGTSGAHAAIGEVLKIEDGMACWKLHPVYAAWFWPLMSRVSDLTLYLPEDLLEPIGAHDSLSAPPAPTESEKNDILQMPERLTDCARVYTLRLPGKPALVHRGFPTRLANLSILRSYRTAERVASSG
ncbi:MAG TPA: hypothetical protein VF132_02865 [Rudaea sp.]